MSSRSTKPLPEVQPILLTPRHRSGKFFYHAILPPDAMTLTQAAHTCGLSPTISPALLTPTLMADVLHTLDQLVSSWFQQQAVYLVLMICTGASAYGEALLLFARRFVREQIRDLKRLLPRGPATLSGAGA